MMKKRRSESDEMFELAGQDPDSWLHQARLLKTSAQLPLNELAKIQQSRGQMSPHERSEALLAYMQSFMLLTSFAFENLIKGILISRAPSMVNKTKLDKDLWGGKDGHKVAEIIPPDIALSEKERDLLIRLQTFARWAGRYPIPLGSDEFHLTERNLTFYPDDPALIEQLFFRLLGQVAV